jgi:hypothetical protein
MSLICETLTVLDVVFWVFTLYSIGGINKSFGGTSCLHFQEAVGSSEMLVHTSSITQCRNED